MLKKVNRNKRRMKRHMKIRNKINGTAEKPRLSVFRSSKHICAQIIDDATGNTLVSSSTMDKTIIDKISECNKTDAAKVIGLTIGEKALEKGINEVVFDRGGYLYHGRVKLLADGARESGLRL